MPQKFTQRAESNDQHHVAELGNKRGGGYRRGACRYRAAHLSADLILAVRTHDSFPSSGLSPPYLENVSFWPEPTNRLPAADGHFPPYRVYGSSTENDMPARLGVGGGHRSSKQAIEGMAAVLAIFSNRLWSFSRVATDARSLRLATKSVITSLAQE